MQDLFNEMYFLNNNLYSAKFLQKDIKGIIDFNQDITPHFNLVKKLYQEPLLSEYYEAQLEDDFIQPVLKMLGWEYLYQEALKIQGRNKKPDFLLFANENAKNNFLKNREDYTQIAAICESKEYSKKLDNNKADESNPHFQLFSYLSYLKTDWGFLTNGRFWRFYDNKKLTSNKVFYEVDLLQIVKENDIEAFKYFFHIFKKDNFIEHPQDKTAPITQIAKKSDDVKIEIEDNLKQVIYGYDGHNSVFAKIGEEIFDKYPQASVGEIYQNTLYFIFRVLFIFYFEDKYAELLKKHKHYNKKVSLTALYNRLKDQQNSEYNGWDELTDIFYKLDKGNLAYQVPVFNGGLFAPANAQLLTHQALINNRVLFNILDNILCYQEGGKSLFRRDFKTLSVVQLGSIYEGLLEFRFEVAQEDTYYAEYETRGKKKEFATGYLDTHDFEIVKKDAQISKQEYYKKGALMLLNSSNSRKSSASFYTPSSLSSFMVKKAVDLELENNKNILALKIIDNACGSGHFLVGALSYLVGKVFEDISKEGKITDAALQQEIEEETEKVKQGLIGFEEEDKEVDQANILKRILLKKIIYGIDFNHFAVELTKLSLWIDTFVFGTPLSFLQHHIKTGNSLMGSTLAELDLSKQEHSLFEKNIKQAAEELTAKLSTLTDLKDTTADDIAKSKQIYEAEIYPLQTKLNRMLDYITYTKIRKIEGHNEPNSSDLLEDLLNGNDNGLAKKVYEYKREYNFFNYEVEFPEAFAAGKKGFNIVIGNPPWDKTKFDDKDFFSQYKFNYRTLINSRKKTVQKDTLAKPHIKARYDAQIRFVDNTNEYYKNNFPHNKDIGDGNLFRFFVERNLSLLAPNASLTYVIPSALMFEDGSQKLREYIFDNYKVNFFYSFENRKGIFNNVHKSYKFALLQIINNKVQAQNINTKFMLLDTKDLYEDSLNIPYTTQLINDLSVEHKALFEFKTNKDIPIMQKIFAKYKPLSPEYLDFRNELHMTADKDLFLEEPTPIPLYEGKMIHQFSSTFEAPKYWLNKKDFDARIESKEIGRLKQSFDKKDLVQMGLVDISKLKKHIKYDREFFRLGFRAIARDTDARTLIFAMLPKNCGVGNSVYVSLPKEYIFEKGQIACKDNLLKSLFLNAVFNSMVLDFAARQMIQINVNKTYIMRLPLPQPTEEEIKKDAIYSQLVKNTLILTLANNWEGFAELAPLFSITKEQTELTEKQYQLLQIANDVMIAKLYGITKEELAYILSTFKVLNKNKPEYGATLLAEYN